MAIAIRAARLGAVLAAVVALLLLALRYELGLALPFDARFLVLLAFLAPIVLALLRARGAGGRGQDPRPPG